MRATRLLPHLASGLFHMLALLFVCMVGLRRTLVVRAVPPLAGTPHSTPGERLTYVVPGMAPLTSATERILRRTRPPRIDALRLEASPGTREGATSPLRSDSVPVPDSGTTPSVLPTSVPPTRGLARDFTARAIWDVANIRSLEAPLAARPRCSDGARNFRCLAREYRWRRDSLFHAVFRCRLDASSPRFLRPPDCTR